MLVNKLITFYLGSASIPGY